MPSCPPHKPETIECETYEALWGDVPVTVESETICMKCGAVLEPLREVTDVRHRAPRAERRADSGENANSGPLREARCT